MKEHLLQLIGSIGLLFVEGCRMFIFNVENLSQFDYEITFINDMNWLCNGYEKKRCSEEYRYNNSQ